MLIYREAAYFASPILRTPPGPAASMNMSEILPFSEVKAHLSELADRVEREHDRVLVTRNGRPSFVMLSLDELEAIEETLDILGDDELVASIARSRREAARGKTVRLGDAI